MGKSTKVVALAVIVALFGLILAGCGSAGQANSGNASQANSQASSGTSGSNNSGSNGGSNSSGGSVKLVMWVNPPAVDAIKKINKDFEQKTGIKAQLQTSANVNGGYDTLKQTSVQANSADIVSIFPFQPLPKNMTASNLTKVQNWAVHGVFADLSDQPWVSNFNKKVLQTAAYKGKQYGLVTGVYQMGVFYNKSIFKKYNLTPPKTYDQMIQVAKTLKSHNVTPFWLGLQNVGPTYLQFITYPLMQEIWGSKVGNIRQALSSGKTKWTDPAFIKVMKREKKLAQYLEPNYTGQSWQGMPGAFASGKAAMLLDGSWDLAAVKKANPKIDVGFFALPGSDTAANNVPMKKPDLTFTVLKGSKNKSAAEKWLNFFASPAEYKKYVKITGISPSKTGGSYQSATATAMGDLFGKGKLMSETSPHFLPNGPYYLQHNNWWKLQLQVIQGKKSPQDAAQLIQKAQDKVNSQ